MRQKLGQHFLTNLDILKKIAGFLDIEDGDAIFEIGPGHGELTKEILTLAEDKNISLSVLERDLSLAEALHAEFQGKINIIEGDALKTLEEVVKGREKYKLAGNIPYYLTGLLLRLIGELPVKPILTVFTIQKEVAERLTARPPEMNRLAAAVQFWGEPEIVGLISKKDFSPPPDVDSATIRIRTKEAIPASHIALKYEKALSALFKQPRKTIGNNLSETLVLEKKEMEGKLKILNIDPKSRPQNLSVEDIIKISAVL